MGFATDFKEMMGIGQPIRTHEDLFLHGLKDIYYGECRMVDDLQTMAEEAISHELKDAFLTHRQETRMQAKRLEEIFDLLGVEAEQNTCEAIEGLIDEAKEILSEAEPPVVDAGLIYAAEAVEHYEIARYTSLLRMAEELGHTAVAKLLRANLNEETTALHMLENMEPGPHATASHTDSKSKRHDHRSS